MNGEFEFASMLIERFTCYHRRSYVCKTGLGDVLIGAAAAIADYNGIPTVSHIKDKLVEMTHLNESIYAAGIASSYQAHRTKSGVWLNDDMLANVCKHNVTRFPYEIGRPAEDSRATASFGSIHRTFPGKGACRLGPPARQDG